MNAYVYIPSNKSRTTFYIGATNDLHRRLLEHRRGKSWFSAQYNLKDLGYYRETVKELASGVEGQLDQECES